MAVIVTSYGKLARKTLRYPKAEKPGNDLSNPRVLASTGVNVSVEGAERVFAMLRRKHGSKGAQSFQTIVSFSKAEMNPDDPADHERAMQLLVVIATFVLPPGTPSVIYLQADGKTGCLHGHVVSCTTLPQDCELDGVKWKAGRKLAGAWTEINAYRQRCNDEMATHGFVNQLEVREKQDVKLTKHESGIKLRQADFDERAAMAQLSKDERRPASSWRMELAGLIERALDDPRAVSWDGLAEVMGESGASFELRVLKSSRTSVTWFPPGRKAGIRGTTLDQHMAEVTEQGGFDDLDKSEQRRARSAARTNFFMAQGSASLGDYFTHESITEMLAQNAAGVPRRRMNARQIEKRPDKPLPEVSDEQVDEARADMARMAAQEQAQASADELHEWLWDHVGDTQLAERSHELGLWQQYGDTFLDDAQMERLHELMEVWNVEQATQQTELSAANRLAYQAARRARLSPQERRVDDLAIQLGLPDDQVIWDELRDVVERRSPALVAADDEDAWVDAHLRELDVNAVLRRAEMPVIGDGDVVAAGHIENSTVGRIEPSIDPGSARKRALGGLDGATENELVASGPKAGPDRAENGQGLEERPEQTSRYEGTGSRLAAAGTASLDLGHSGPATRQNLPASGPDVYASGSDVYASGSETGRGSGPEESFPGTLDVPSTIDSADAPALAETEAEQSTRLMPAVDLSRSVAGVQSPAVSAPAAAGTPAAGSAPATPPMYRSPLWDVEPEGETPKQRRERRAMAKFDDYARPVVLRRARIDDTQVPAGITHEKLAAWRKRGLSQETFDQMTLRRTKYEASQAEWDHGMELKLELEAMDAMGMTSAPGYRTRKAQLRVSNARVGTLRAEIAAGIYEDLTAETSGGGGGSGGGHDGSGPGSSGSPGSPRADPQPGG